MQNTSLQKQLSKDPSINRRFSYSLIIVVTLILICFSSIVIFVDNAKINTKLEQHFNYVLNLAQVSLKTPMWSFSEATITGFVEALFLDESVVYINVSEYSQMSKNNQGNNRNQSNFTKIHHKFKGRDLSYFKQSSKFLLKTSDIFYNQEKVGSIQLVMSRESIQREAKSDIFLIVVLMIFEIVAISLTSLVITRRFVSLPLSKLQDSATLIANGELETPIDISSNDEIGKLARDFNAMRESLKELFEALRQSNRTLELRVNERTRAVRQELTVRRRAEADLQQQKQTLERTLDELKHTQSQLVQSEKMAGLGTLVAGVAHEINNPVNFVLNGSENVDAHLQELKRFIFDIAGDGASPTLRQSFEERFDRLFTFLDTITHGSNRIKNIVDDLRTFSRLDEAEKTAFRVVEGIESSLRLVEAEYKRQVVFIRDFQANPSIDGWPAQLKQVYLNIIVNACQAIVAKQKQMEDESPGTLTVHTAVQGDHVAIRFQDTGCGIPRDVQEKMFEPFYTTKPVGEGTGLGMSISYGIIEKHQGRILVESLVNEGATITVLLPLKVAADQSESTAKARVI